MLYLMSLLTTSTAGILGWALVLSGQPLLGGLILLIAFYHGYTVSVCMAGRSTSFITALTNLYPNGPVSPWKMW